MFFGSGDQCGRTREEGDGWGQCFPLRQTASGHWFKVSPLDLNPVVKKPVQPSTWLSINSLCNVWCGGGDGGMG